MIELNPEDAAFILKISATQGLDSWPTAQLNEEGQTEILRWVEYVGRGDDRLTPYAWFSLAEEAAFSHDPEEPVLIEMLPTFTLSGDTEVLELCRINHFDWTIDSIPAMHIENAESLFDAGVPLRCLLLAEAAGLAFTKTVSRLCPDLSSQETLVLARAINAFCIGLCESTGMLQASRLLSATQDETPALEVDRVQWQVALEESLEAARKAMLLLDPDMHFGMPDHAKLLQRLNI